MKLNKLVLASAVSMALAACGGGGGGSADNAPPAATAPLTVVFAGTAAVGAPLTGTVTVKDSKGATKTATIGANGAYSVDVTGMTGPFVFRATGSANGQTYTVHSIANSGDAAGKINITQLTDLVAANVGGQLASDYFDQFEKNGVAANATSAAIDAEVAKLKEKLQAILTALGVDANIDLLRTPFTPLSSPVDKALDAIHVSVDSTTAVATISTTANTSVITDDLKQKATAETNPPKLTADNISTAATDAPLVKKALTDLIAKFANGAPAVADLTALATTGFLQNDMGAQDFFSWLVKETDLIGATFTDIEIHQIDYSDPGKITAQVSFTVKSKDGAVLERLEGWKVRKGTDGVWRVHGNQRVLELAATVGMSKIVNASGTCYRTGINFTIMDRNSANNTTGAAIDHIVITGPGLPAAGLRYNAAGLTSEWNNTVTSSPAYVMSSDCAGFVSPMGDDGVARIPDNAAYVVTAYDAANAKLSFASGTSEGTYILKTQRRPLTLTETKASTAFPVISDQTISALSSFTSGTFAVAGSNVNPSAAAWVGLGMETSLSGNARNTGEAALPTTAGAFSTSLQMPALQQGETVKSRNLRVESPDGYRRTMETVYIR
jgi:hypothetical protein